MSVIRSIVMQHMSVPGLSESTRGHLGDILAHVDAHGPPVSGSSDESDLLERLASLTAGVSSMADENLDLVPGPQSEENGPGTAPWTRPLDETPQEQVRTDAVGIRASDEISDNRQDQSRSDEYDRVYSAEPAGTIQDEEVDDVDTSTDVFETGGAYRRGGGRSAVNGRSQTRRSIKHSSRKRRDALRSQTRDPHVHWVVAAASAAIALISSVFVPT